MYEISKLSNGVTVATAAMPHMSSVSLGIWVGVGGRFEPPEVSGISHFIEHMLFKGTRKRNAQQISESVEGIGGYLNAFTSEENTCFYAKACAVRLPELWSVLSDMFLNSVFDATEIEKERNVIKEELAMYLDQPQHHVHELLNELMWPGQPLGRSLTGTVETLDGMSRKHLFEYLKQNYVGLTTLICVAGSVDHNDTVNLIAPLAKKLDTGRKPRFAPAFNDQEKARVRLFTKKTEQTQMALGVRTFSRHDPQRYALRLLSTMLGENMSSRLFQVVREDHGLAYSIASSISFFDDTGDLTIGAGVETEKYPRALKLIIQELRRLCESKPPLAELRRARDYVIGQMEMSLENTENQMMYLGENLLGLGKVISPTEVKDKLFEVTPSQIRNLARMLCKPERLSLALVSPIKEPKSSEKILRSMAA
jgi:predicted Zn-dependent peptidase